MRVLSIAYHTGEVNSPSMLESTRPLPKVPSAPPVPPPRHSGLGCRGSSGPARFRLLHPQVEDGKHDQDQNRGANHPSYHWGGEGPHHFGSGLRAPHQGDEAKDDGRDRHHFRPKPLDSPLHDRPFRVVTAETIEGLPKVDQHYDAGFHGRAEEGDEADPDRDAEVVSRE